MSDAQPLVSIVTPAYKAARFVGETIESVLAQTYPHWEMLIVEDCSPDNTAEVVQEYERRDSRVRLIRHAKNGGPATARNTAIEAARGHYIAFLDSDDLWLPQKLERQVGFMEAERVAISYTSLRRITETGELVTEPVKIPLSLDYRGLLRQTAIVTSTGMVNRAITGDFRMKKTHYDDYALWLELTRRGHVARGLPEDLARYRLVGNSFSRNKLKSAKEVWKTYRNVEQLGLLTSGVSFAFYAWHAYRKYRA